jgi:dihydrofolate synthase/folylpolyglutamate synthase
VARSYEETLEYLYSRLPVFQRIGAAAYKPGLNSILHFCSLVGNPQNKFPTIHIGGTNGKGSTSHSIASVLQEEGYKTGLYTSPHLVDFRERIRINGEMVPKDWVVEKINQWEPFIEQISPSFFELTVALAFVYFAENKIDIGVIEVGMGGRLDSTNIITPLVSVITNIGLDHQKFLGNTLREIAGEKAGIMKKNVPTVVSERQPETNGVFEAKSQELDSGLFFAEDWFEIQDLGLSNGYRELEVFNLKNQTKKPLQLSLLGDYQIQNVKGILVALELLKQKGFPTSEEALKSGLSKVQKNTGLMGRWQILQQNPVVICDTGHNEDGVKRVLKQLKSIPHQTLWMIWGMVNDKDHENILRLLPKDARYLITEPKIPRAMPREEMTSLFLEKGFQAESFFSVAVALENALLRADSEDLIFIGGSTFTVADIPFEKFSASH